MSRYIEFNDSIAFHPGYYLKELVEESGLTQEDFAKRLGTTPKNLSILIRGEQNLSEIQSAEELKREREVFAHIDYKYFKTFFGFPNLSRKVDEQIRYLREYLSVSSLSVLKEKNLAVSFRSYSKELSLSNTINANVMVQIGINQTINRDIPKFNKKKFEKAAEYALKQTKNHAGFFPLIRDAFGEAGVSLVVLPNLKNSGINGATKKVNGKVMLMVNDRRHYADTFWFTLFHEIGHILNGDLGASFSDASEDEADLYARNALIPQDAYDSFVKSHSCFDEAVICSFADSIGQDPGIVLGRLLKDRKVSHTNTYLQKKLRHRYNVMITAPKA